MNRRNFIKSGLILLGAPAIIKAENAMKIFVHNNTVFSGCDYGAGDDKTVIISGTLKYDGTYELSEGGYLIPQDVADELTKAISENVMSFNGARKMLGESDKMFRNRLIEYCKANSMA